MKRLSAAVLGGFLTAAVLAPAQAQPAPSTTPTTPTLTVTGQGEVSATPDQATVRLGAVAQASDAAEAQEEVNHIVEETLQAIRELQVPQQKIRTAGLSLSPVYAARPMAKREGETVIVGFRASNTIEVQLTDLRKVGAVLDAGVQSGANQIEGIVFELKNDTDQRRKALKEAAAEARAKAEAIAEAMGLDITGVLMVNEGGVNVVQPQLMKMAGAGMARDTGTPVESGQVQISASVTVQYVIAPGAGAGKRPSTTAPSGRPAASSPTDTESSGTVDSTPATDLPGSPDDEGTSASSPATPQ